MLWLLIITALAIIIRSIPGWINTAWGCDFGIYFGITKSMAESGTLFPFYAGWGGSYNEFPVLYALNSFAHRLTGIEIIDLMPKLTPIFGGLSVLLFFFIVRKLSDNKKISILATLFFAFLPFHVYQTSHASPLTMGHFFIMLSLFFFLKYRENTMYAIPLLISTVLLIMSHHLSTYFFLISLIGIVFFENAGSKNWTSTVKKDVLYIFVLSMLMFSYWALIARTVYAKFMVSGFSIAGIRIDAGYIILLFYLVLIFIFFIGVKLVRMSRGFIVERKETVKSPIGKILIKLFYRISPFIKKRWPSTRSRVLIFLVILIILPIAMILFSVISLPWLGFSFTNEAIIFSFPLVVAVAFGAAGLRYTLYAKNGLFIRGWLIAIVFSLLFMMLINNRTILPHRHPEYLMAPLAILMAYGIGGIFSDPFFKGLFSGLKIKRDFYVHYASGKVKILRRNRLLSIFVIFIFVASLVGTTYEVHRALNQSWEEITAEDASSIEWISMNLDVNTSIIASDHRLERFIEGDGFNTSGDEVIKLWASENLSEFVEELFGIGKNYSRLTHVVVDDVMKNKGVHIGPKGGVFRTIYMTNETWNASYLKFKKQPFELVYKNESKQIDSITLEPIHWAEVYAINWTYIESVI